MTTEDTSIFTNLFPKKLWNSSEQIFSRSLYPVLLSIDDIEEVMHKSLFQLKDVLHPHELDEYHNYSLEKRKREFLAGRICSKSALINYFKTQRHTKLSFTDLLITNDPTGRPAYSVPANPGLIQEGDISISHSDQFGCAVFAANFCGIDIQAQNKTLIKVKDRYCTAEEEALLHKANGERPVTMENLALLWAAKEACKKALSADRMPGFLDMTLRKIEPSDCQIKIMYFTIDNQNTMKISVRSFQNYGLALTLTK